MDLILSGEEDQHVSMRQLLVNPQALLHSSLSIVLRSGLLVVRGHWEHARLDVDDRNSEVEQFLVLEVLDAHGGTHDDESQRLALALKRELVAHDDESREQANEDIGVDFPLMGLIDYDHAIGVEHVVRAHFVEQDAVGQVLDQGRGAVLPLVPHLETNGLSQLSPHFLGHSAGQGNGGQSPRLRDGDLAELVVVLFNEELPDLSALAGTCLSADESDKVLVDGLHYLLLLHVDGQLFSELCDFLAPCDDVVASGNGDVGVRDVLEAVGLVFVLGELYFLLIFDDL